MSDDHLTVPDDDTPPDDAASGGTAPEGSDEDATPADPVCPECGAPVEPDQPYCLECGAPTSAAIPLRKRGATVPVILAALLALAVGGGALIWALTRKDTTAEASTDTVTALTTAVPPFTTAETTTSYPPFTNDTSTEDPFDTSSTETTDPFATDETDTTDPFATDETDTTDPFATDETDTTDPFGTTETDTTDTTDTTDSTDTSDGWTGGDAFTVILSSVTDRAAADRFAQRVNGTGRTAGVLVSDNYSSLRAGFYVVFTGVYSTAAEANTSARTLRASYPGAYAAHISG